MSELQLFFLGTGGGRFATITQKRRTGGMRILAEDANIHIDPGPGALVYSIASDLNPQKINAVLVSHNHPDHYNDAEVLIEAMTRGATKKRGLLAAPRSVLFGNETCDPSISRYHQQIVNELVEAKPGTSFQVGKLRVTVTEARHSDPDTVGFKFETPHSGEIAYTSDTEYFEGIGKNYEGVRLLILCVMRPAGRPWKWHMTTEDAIKIVSEAKPEMAIITHFGMEMIFKGPTKQAQMIQEETNVPTVAATDQMKVSINEEINIVKPHVKRQHYLNEFFIQQR